ncbi:Vms1/Ankzf1 family peptidyl-tRNA hydrolase [Streptomyces sp. NPDC002187]|uniref:baeRF2 domain-containing protein n=1 Tax=Streptomyces sp. NPDC002187 TaxID=3364637 RepID=UPI00367662B7
MRLSFLNTLYERPGPWASVHLDTGRTAESTPARRELQAREACGALRRQGADEATGQAVYEALTGEPGPAGGAGRAVFAAGGQVVLDRPLATAPPTAVDTRWSALPRVAPLLDLAAQEPVCLVAYIDRIGADLEVRTPLGRRSAGQAQGLDWPVHRAGRDELSDSHFQRSVENTWEHNAEEVAKAIVTCQEEAHADVIVLAGDVRERRSVHRRLPAGLQDRVVESGHGGRAEGASAKLLDEDVKRAAEEHVRRSAAAGLDRFRSAHETAAEGVRPLVDAAREHRIAELFVCPEGGDTHREVWVGPEPDQVAVRRSDAHYLGEMHPSSARADDALLRSAAMTGAPAQVVHIDGVGSVPAGGLGALLRWPSHDGGHQ